MTRREFGFFATTVLHPQERADIRTTVRLVVIPASVKNGKDHPIDGLEEQDFEVRVDQKVDRHRLEFDTQPISLVVAVETSQGSGPALAKIVKSASMIEPLISGDRGELSLLSFGPGIKIWQQFDHELATALFRDMRPRGGGVLILDAVNTAADLLETRPSDRRRIILLISQSRDQGSQASLEAVTVRVQKSNISVYALTYSPFLSNFTVKRSEKLGRKGANEEESEKREAAYQPGGGMDLLPLFRGLRNFSRNSATEVLTRVTGGLELRFVKQDRLEEIVQHASEDLHRQYLLTIEAPGALDDQFHEINVSVRRPDAVVRARSGYWGGVD